MLNADEHTAFGLLTCSENGWYVTCEGTTVGTNAIHLLPILIYLTYTFSSREVYSGMPLRLSSVSLTHGPFSFFLIVLSKRENISRSAWTDHTALRTFIIMCVLFFFFFEIHNYASL